MLYIDLEKSTGKITRAQAKAKHPSLPPGGAWRTIKGHHVYVKDGQVVAGAGVGKTGKPIKLTKQHLATHQAHVDKETKAKTTPKKAPAKKAPAKKAPAKKTTATAKKTPVKKPTAKKAPAKKPTATKAPAPKAKAPVKKTTASKAPVKKTTATAKAPAPKPKTGAKKTFSAEQLKDMTDSFQKIKAQAKEHAKAEAQEAKPKQAKPQEAKPQEAKPQEATSIPGVLDTLSAEEIKDLTAKYQKMGDTSLKVTYDSVKYAFEKPYDEALEKSASRLDVLDLLKFRVGKEPPSEKRDKHLQRLTLEHNEALSAHAKLNEDFLKAREDFAKNHPVAIEHHKRQDVKHKKYLAMMAKTKTKLNTEVEEMKKKPPVKVHVPDKVEIFHGTAVPHLSKILKNGFKTGGAGEDFGNASYFKSPVFDAKDDEALEQHILENHKKGYNALSKDQYTPYDTVNVVDWFSDKISGSAVVKAQIDKKHVLNCADGRPKELQTVLDEIKKVKSNHTALINYMGEYLLGYRPHAKEVHDYDSVFHNNLKKVWGRIPMMRHVSGYELYAKKHGIKAVVDRLDMFRDEGWQIGVYDPSIITILDHGKKIKRGKNMGEVELLKALLKTLKQLPYCLLHHSFDKDGHLILHVGVLDDMKKSIEILDLSTLDIVNEPLRKSETAKKLTGGEWRTVHGRHVYIKDGTIVLGAFAGQKISELGKPKEGEKTNDGNEGKQGKQQATGSKTATGAEDKQPSTVGKESTGSGSGDNGRAKSTGQDGQGNSGDSSRVRNLSKEAIPARKDTEYNFHRIEGKEGASEFHKAIMASKKGNSHGAFVHAYEEAEYVDTQMYLSEGGEAGFVIKKNGDIASLFHNPTIGTKKGVIHHTIELALQRGGNRLDCFDGFLPKQYAKWGFEPVAKMDFAREYAPEGWNFERDGEPDVLFFAHNGDALDKIHQTNYPLPDLGKVPKLSDYDDGIKYQDAYLEGKKSPVKKGFDSYHGMMKSIMKGW